MECIFKSELDIKPMRKIICELTMDMMNVYKYNGYVSVMNAILSAEADLQEGREYMKSNGQPYLFDPPYLDILYSDVPIFLSTPRQWTKQVTQVKGLTDYKRLITLLELFFFKEQEIFQDIVCKFNRDMISYNNMQQLLNVTQYKSFL